MRKSDAATSSHRLSQPASKHHSASHHQSVGAGLVDDANHLSPDKKSAAGSDKNRTIPSATIYSTGQGKSKSFALGVPSSRQSDAKLNTDLMPPPISAYGSIID